MKFLPNHSITMRGYKVIKLIKILQVSDQLLLLLNLGTNKLIGSKM